MRLFNKETDFTMEEFMKTEWYAVLLLNSGKFNLTKWRYYTDEEKAQDERKRLIGGELITIPYKEACANWWASLSEVDKAIIRRIDEIINFNVYDYETLTQDAERFLQDKNSHQIQRHFHQALNSNQAQLDKEDWWIKWR